MHLLRDLFASFDLVHPLSFAGACIVASLLVWWRVEALLARGLEGTAIGTLILPYSSGLGNLLLVAIILRGGRAPEEIVVNSVVNNVTNLTLLLGLPALLAPLVVVPPKGETASRQGKRGSRNRARRGAEDPDAQPRLNRLSLLLTLAAVVFFTGAVWVLGSDGQLSRIDGIVLVGLFGFWQLFQLVDVLKHNVRSPHTLGPSVLGDLALIAGAAVVMYESLDWLVAWIESSPRGWIRADNLGWITGWLLVVPNAILALVFAIRRRADLVYSSQIGDGHICIPLCIGLAALVQPLALPEMFEQGAWILLSAGAVHTFALSTLGALPRPLAALLCGAYGWFLYAGFLD